MLYIVPNKSTNFVEDLPTTFLSYLLSNGGKVERGQDLKIMDNWQRDENGSPQDPLRQVILTKERKKTCNLHQRKTYLDFY